MEFLATTALADDFRTSVFYHHQFFFLFCPVVFVFELLASFWFFRFNRKCLTLELNKTIVGSEGKCFFLGQIIFWRFHWPMYGMYDSCVESDIPFIQQILWTNLPCRVSQKLRRNNAHTPPNHTRWQKTHTLTRVYIYTFVCVCTI